MRRNSRHSRTAVAIIGTSLALSLCLSACGDDDETPTSGSSGDSSSASGGQEAAAELVAELEKRPTTTGNDTPIGKPVPEGVDVTYVTCGAPTCSTAASIIKEATDILGWNLQVLETDGTPGQIQNAWDQVIREKPEVALYAGTDHAQIASQLQEAADNGTFIAAQGVADEEPTDGQQFIVNNGVQRAAAGRASAAWVVNDAVQAGIDDPNALFVYLPDFPILIPMQEEFAKSFEEFCPGCTQDKIGVGLADIANSSDLVVSYIRSHPDVKYVVLAPDSPFAGLPAALKAAGLNDVQIFGTSPDGTSLAYIEDGQQSAALAFSFYEDFFAMVDAAARNEAGAPLVEGIDPPLWIVKKGTIPSVDEVFPLVPDVVEQYAALWGK